MALLELKNVTIRFGGLTAVQGLTLAIQQGEIFSLIGPNGAGKTTVFNAITGVYPPTEGAVFCGQKEIVKPWRWQTLASLIGIGFATAFGMLLAVNIETFWTAAITDRYVYQEAFPWQDTLRALWSTGRSLSTGYSLLPFICGLLLGISGAWSVWIRSRRSPEVAAQAGVARTFQNIRLFPQLSVLENVLVGMHARLRSNVWDSVFRTPRHRREARQAEAEAMELLTFVDLADEAHLRAASLSYGHQRRLEIARALASRPKLLLLDEPAAGMNPAEAHSLMDLILKIRDSGVTVLLIEHHMKVVMGISDRIAVLEYGNKIAEGVPEEIKQNPNVIQAYLGTEGTL